MSLPQREESGEAKSSRSESGNSSKLHGTVSVSSVCDGDTFVTDKNKIRIWGINAPEHTQPGYWAAGVKLEKLIGGREITCIKRQSGMSYDREVMQCHIGKKDIGREMVKAGLAKEMKNFSKGYYTASETSAKKAGRGLWSGLGAE